MGAFRDSVVMKFGGTSVNGASKMMNAARRIIEKRKDGCPVAVVVSAMGKTTDRLIDMAREAGGATPDGREVDHLLATGEQQSAALLALTLNAMGYPACSFTGVQAGVLAEGPWGEGHITSVNPLRIRDTIAGGTVAVVAGFQGVTRGGDVITLGRGGSDLSAVALAAALHAKECHILTDVSGIYTADPRRVPDAKKLRSVSWDECIEMGVCGARVMQPRSVEMACRLGMPIHLASSDTAQDGTWISGPDVSERPKITAVASDERICRLTLPPGGKAPWQEISEAFSESEIVTVAITTHPCDAIYVRGDQGEKAQSLCRSLLDADVPLSDGFASVSVIGHGVGNHPEILNGVLRVLARCACSLYLVFSSGSSVRCILPGEAAAGAVLALHEAFIEKEGDNA